MLRRVLLAILLALAVRNARAQTIGQNKSPSSEEKYTLSVRSQLVVEAVVVKDKQGNPVNGLTAKDFTLTEDGVVQKIRFCEHQTLPATALPLLASKPSEEDLKIYKKLSGTQINGESPENLKYKDRRLLALYFDMSAMRPADQLRALTAAEKFIPHTDHGSGSGLHPQVPGRLCRCAAGLHGRPQQVAEHSADADSR